jgi:hypothetical protein
MNQRIKLAIILFVFEIVSKLALSITPRDETYFLVAGAFSLLIMPCIYLTENTSLRTDMMVLALLVVITQVVGFYLYKEYVTGKIYNVIIYLLLACQVVRLLIVRAYDGGYPIANSFSLLHRDTFNRNPHSNQNTK